MIKIQMFDNSDEPCQIGEGETMEAALAAIHLDICLDYLEFSEDEDELIESIPERFTELDHADEYAAMCGFDITIG